MKTERRTVRLASLFYYTMPLEPQKHYLCNIIHSHQDFELTFLDDELRTGKFSFNEI